MPDSKKTDFQPCNLCLTPRLCSISLEHARCIAPTWHMFCGGDFPLRPVPVSGGASALVPA